MGGQKVPAVVAARTRRAPSNGSSVNKEKAGLSLNNKPQNKKEQRVLKKQLRKASKSRKRSSPEDDNADEENHAEEEGEE